MTKPIKSGLDGWIDSVLLLNEMLEFKPTIKISELFSTEKFNTNVLFIENKSITYCKP